MDKQTEKHHISFMNQALVQARKAFEADEVPIGAIVVDPQGTIISRAYNKVEKVHSQSGHAEVLAIVKAGKKLGDWRLNGCWIYVTLEPCAMCLHLILLSRLEGIVFGASSPVYGYHLDKIGTLSIYKNRCLPVKVIEAVCVEESVELLKHFFIKKREM